MREPLRIKIEMGSGKGSEKIITSVVADGAFALSFSDETAAHFLVEIDRGTMPVMRKGSTRTSIKRKFEIYLEAWRAGVFEQQFGVRQMRVLFITTSKERIETMLEAQKALTDGKGTGLFLFVDRPTLEASSSLQAGWVSGKGEVVHLAD